MIRVFIGFLFDLFRGEYKEQSKKDCVYKQLAPDLIQLKLNSYFYVETYLCLLVLILIVSLVSFDLEFLMIANVILSLGFSAIYALTPIFQSNRRILIGLFIEKYLQNVTMTEKVHFVSLYSRNINCAGYIGGVDIWEIFPEDYLTNGVVLKYCLLPDSAKSKQSKCIKPFRYYDCADHISLKCKSVNWIMTKQKSDLLDELIRLEPPAEFEICYLKYSKLLLEIRPIEGWEYAEGVPELCEKISKMYP